MSTIRTKLFYILLLVCCSFGILSAQVTADFSIINSSGCSPLVVTFQDQSTGSPTQWQWYFGNGNGSVQHNPSAIYLNPGVYTVTLIASDGVTSDTMVQVDAVTVFQDPTADLSASSTSGCIPYDVTFTDNSTPGDAAVTSWLWDFGDGSTSTDQTPTHTYTNPGVYTVTMLVQDANGCRNEVTYDDYITIGNVPVASFTATPVSACTAPLTVDFTNTSTGYGNLSAVWDFGDSTTSTQASPSHTYTSPGVYTVSMTITDDLGCDAVVIQNDLVDIHNITAGFSINDSSVCAGQGINFTDLSAPGATAWAWDFGDSTTSSTQNPIHAYATAGTYTVQLIVTGDNGCKDTLVQTNLVEVFALPTADFTSDTTGSCAAPLDVQFTDLSANAVSWSWDFGDGGTSTSQNPSYTYNTPGTYDVSLTVLNADGCSHTQVMPSYISIELPNVDIDANIKRGCIPLPVSFTDESTSTDSIVGWNWDFGDGNTSNQQDPINIYTTPGIYDVTLEVTTLNGCTALDTFPQYIMAGDTPTVEFMGTPLKTCLYFPVSFYDTAAVSGDYWFWDFGDGGTSLDQNPTYQYGDTGVFNITLIVGHNGCFDTLMKPNYVTIYPPDARFNVYFDCADHYHVDFVNNSLGGHLWNWDFGDGATADSINVEHTYASRGDYTVTLVVRDTVGGCSDTTAQTITITDPIAGFTGTNLAGCVSHQADFTSTSTDAYSYQWLFGDGSTGAGQDASHTYNTPGVYDVTLVITDIHNCTDTFVQPNYVTVYGATAGFYADTLTGCTPLPVSFFDSSSSAMGTITSWEWDLGNGATDTNQNTTTNYTIPGNYTVRLVVGDSNGCFDTLNKVNYIVPTYPTPGFTASQTTICLGSPVQFNNSSAGVGLNYEWDFGDGDTSTAANPTHAYADTGIYTVMLYVQDVNGCDSSIVRTNYITVIQPRAEFSVDTLVANCPPLVVNFTNVVAPGDSIVGWQYNFGDNSTSSLANPSHIYNRPGTYHPSLIVTNVLGCKDTFNLPDSVVIGGPWGSFTFVQNSVCIPFDVEFHSSVTDTNVLHIWDFGDGDVMADDDTTSHAYTYPGTFNPVMILDDQMGCLVSIPSPGPINATTVVANFEAIPADLCQQGTITFNNLSTGAPDVASWYWTFGDGSSSTDENPSHYYTTPGNYDVQLVAFNSSGCSDTMFRPGYIKIHPGPTAQYNVDVQQTCQGNAINFTDASTGSDTSIASHTWYFGDGDTSVLNNPAYTYANPGTYTSSIIVTDARGCKDTTTLPITIDTLPMATATINSPVCIGDTAILAGTGGVSYLWNPGSTLEDSTMATTQAYPTSSTTYHVLVTDGNGCQGTDSATVIVNPLPVPMISADQAICSGDTAQLSITGGISFLWTPGQEVSDSLAPDPVTGPTSTTTYQVSVTDTNGCVNTASTTVTVNPLPTTGITPPQEICEGDTTSMTATGGNNYQWSNDGSLNTSTGATVIAYPAATTSYQVTVTDANGCVNQDSSSITVNNKPVPVITPDHDICIGDSTTLSISGGVSYQWAASASLSCTNCADPMAYPDTTTTYSVEVTDVKGCKATTSVTITVRPLPVITTSGDKLICQGASTQLNATGGASYSWSPAVGLSCTSCQSPVASPDSNTTYTVTVTSSYGCSSTASLDITVHHMEAAIGASDSAFCVPGSVNFTDLSVSDSAIVSWGWNFGNGSSSTQTNPGYTYSQPGLYPVKLRIVSSAGCADTTTLPISVWILPTADAGPDQTICNMDTVALSATGGTSYNWSNASSLSDSSIANPRAFPSSDQSYVLTVTDMHGCQDTDTMNIKVNALPVATITSDSAACYGREVQLQAAGGIQYQWSPANSLNNDTIADPIARPLTSETYTVTVTDANGCQDTESKSITIYPGPLATATGDTTLCIGGSAQLGVTSGYDYQWGPVNSLDCSTCAQPVATPQSTTNYTVIITDQYGCYRVDSAEVQVNPLPVITTSADTVVCTYENVTLNSTGGQSYLWSSTEPIPCDTCATTTINAQNSATYQVLVTTAAGCSDVDSVTVSVSHINADYIASDTVMCAPADIEFTDLSSSDAPIVSWNWHFGDGDSSDVQHPDHTYLNDGIMRPRLTVTSSLGCTDIATQTVEVLEKPVATSSQDTAICYGEAVELNATGGGNYSWSNGGSLSDSTAANPTAQPNRSTLYSVVVTLANGCTDTASTAVIVNPLPTASVIPNRSACEMDSIQLSASGGINYVWSPATGLSDPNVRTPMAYINNDITYQVAVYNSYGCSDTDSITVTMNPLPALTINTPNGICLGDTATLSVSGASSYIWGANPLVDCRSCSTVTTTPKASATYYVRGTSAEGCSIIDSASLEVHALPEVQTIDDHTICKGETIPLTTTATPGTSISWTSGSSLSSASSLSPIARPSQTTSYRVTATNQYGCTDEDEVTISLIEGISIAPLADTTICQGGAVRFTPRILEGPSNGDSVTFNWLPVGDFAGSDVRPQIFKPQNTQTYTLVVSGGSCAPVSHDVTITVNQNPQPDLGPDQFVFTGTNVTLDANAGDNINTYDWAPFNGLDCYTCEVVNHIADAQTTYRVSVVDNNGCVGADSVNIYVTETCGDDLFVPNSFSPNGDGANDVLYVRGKHLSGIRSFRIFDRWGNLVFESKDMSHGWNGLYKGRLVDSGVYVYFVEAICDNGGTVRKKGNVTLLN